MKLDKLLKRKAQSESMRKVLICSYCDIYLPSSLANFSGSKVFKETAIGFAVTPSGIPKIMQPMFDEDQKKEGPFH